MSKLDNLIRYQKMSRRVGHTTLMTEGIHFNRRAFILFASMNHATMAFRETLERHALGEIEALKPDFGLRKIGEVQFSSINLLDGIEETMRGFHYDQLPPIIVDHFAMEQLIAEHEAEMEKRYDSTKNS